MMLGVDGKNDFHLGWLAAFLRLPREHPSAETIKGEPVLAFADGWDMCMETPATGFLNRYRAFEAMREAEQAIAFWADDLDDINQKSQRMLLGVDGDTYFHTGWLAAFLGLPRERPHAESLKDGHISDFNSGWDKCKSIPVIGLPNRYQAFEEMLRRKQGYTFWADDAARIKE